MRNPLADLQPPLGTGGGPCRVVNRIRHEVNSPNERDRLEDAVELGKALTNEQAAEVYDLEPEAGVGPIKRILLGPHSQYRMDLRAVTVEDIRRSLANFYKRLNDLKSRHDWEYEFTARELGNGEGVHWDDPKTGLTVVFSMVDSFTAKIVTTYWTQGHDPRAPGLGKCVDAAGPAPEKFGPQTNVSPRSRDGIPPDDDAPPPGGTPHGRNIPQPSFNGPDGTIPVPVRTLGVPGGDDPHPWKDSIQQRRVTVGAFRITPSHRQHRQHGADRVKAHLNYLRNRSRLRTTAHRRYRIVSHNPAFKRQQTMRHRHPAQHRRINACLGTMLGFVYGPNYDRGDVLGFRPDGKVWLLLHPADGPKLIAVSIPVLVSRVIFLSHVELDAFFVWADSAFTSAKLSFMYERVPANEADSAKPTHRIDRPDAFHPAREGPDYYVQKGPARPGTIPSHGLIRKASAQRVAATIAEIQARMDPTILQASQTLQAHLARVDRKAGQWTFEVPSSKVGSAPYKVRVKAVGRGQAKTMRKADVWVSCSCPFWRWQGPEHWAKTGDYLLGHPVGTASKPVIKDPHERKVACKHVLAVFRKVSAYDVLEAR